MEPKLLLNRYETVTGMRMRASVRARARTKKSVRIFVTSEKAEENIDKKGGGKRRTEARITQ